MTHTLLFLALAAAPRVASPGLVVHEISADKASFYTEHFSAQLTLAGLRVVTAKDMASLIGLEKQKELLGCSDGSGSCLAEMASALGADAVALGDIARIGTDRYQMTVKIINAADGTTLGLRSSRVTGEEALLDELSKHASSLAAEVKSKLNPNNAAGAEVAGVSTAPSKRVALVPAAATVVLGVGAGICFGLASGDSDQLIHATPGAQGASVRDQGRAFQITGWVAASVAVVALAAAVVVFLIGGSSDAGGGTAEAVTW